jgi:hypothetical protein
MKVSLKNHRHSQGILFYQSIPKQPNERFLECALFCAELKRRLPRSVNPIFMKDSISLENFKLMHIQGVVILNGQSNDGLNQYR